MTPKSSPLDPTTKRIAWHWTWHANISVTP